MKNEIPGPGTYDPEQIKSHINTKKMILTNEYNNKMENNLKLLKNKVK